MIRIASSYLVWTALSTPVLWADVWDVGGPQPDAADIAQALALATDGDVVRVWPGTYGSFEINALSVSIVPFQAGGDVSIAGTVVVRNLTLGQSVELSGLRAYDAGDTSTLRLLQNAGSVRIQDCAFEQRKRDTYWYVAGGSIENCQDVSIVSTSFEGANGLDTDYGQAYDGHDALRVTDSRVALYRCAFSGGIGGSGLTCTLGGPGLGGDGGHGVRLLGQGELFASLCIMVGGWQGYDDWQCSFGEGDSGLGLATDAAGVAYDVRLLETYTANAQGTGSGYWVHANSTLQVLSGQAARLGGPAWISDGEALELTVHGQPGDRVGLFYATAYDHETAPPMGPLLVEVGTAPNYATWSYLGEIGAGGVLQHSLPMRDLPAFSHVKLHLVAVTVSATGRQYTHSLSPLVLDSAW